MKLLPIVLNVSKTESMNQLVVALMVLMNLVNQPVHHVLHNVILVIIMLLLVLNVLMVMSMFQTVQLPQLKDNLLKFMISQSDLLKFLTVPCNVILVNNSPNIVLLVMKTELTLHLVTVLKVSILKSDP